MSLRARLALFFVAIFAWITTLVIGFEVFDGIARIAWVGILSFAMIIGMGIAAWRL